MDAVIEREQREAERELIEALEERLAEVEGERDRALAIVERERALGARAMQREVLATIERVVLRSISSSAGQSAAAAISEAIADLSPWAVARARDTQGGEFVIRRADGREVAATLANVIAFAFALAESGSRVGARLDDALGLIDHDDAILKSVGLALGPIPEESIPEARS
jgi:hypothetical protein